MRLLKFKIKILLVAISVTAAGFLARPAHELAMYSLKGSSVVMLTAGRSGGTGFRVQTIKGNTYILSNRHVCNISKSGDMIATDIMGNRHWIKVIEKSMVHDLCILEDIPTLPALKLGSEPNWKESMYILGHPALRPLTLQRGNFISNVEIGVMTSCNKYELEAAKKEINKKFKELQNMCKEGITEDCFLGVLEIGYLQRMLLQGMCVVNYNADHVNLISYGGNSGSPILSKWGRVVGVLFAGYRGQPTASYMVPLSYVEGFLHDK